VFEAYAAGKVWALVATRDFLAANKPEWDVVNILLFVELSIGISY
jgi:hypothetical protein